MDWGNVTAEDLIDALREVDWSSPPRPLSEFFSRFTLPKSSSKWNSRLKCNLYYYRTNYFIMMVLIMGLGFLRRPLAIVAALLTALSIAFMNDSTFSHIGNTGSGIISSFRGLHSSLYSGVLAVSVATKQSSLTGLEILRLRLLMFTYLQYVIFLIYINQLSGGEVFSYQIVPVIATHHFELLKFWN
ncbi:hypothetical protein NC652_016148 [Populus alba x Populus x berolinensis]|nr:hypothetical protein NC652_016148 [Populus alba x Populus x berolinensis]